METNTSKTPQETPIKTNLCKVSRGLQPIVLVEKWFCRLKQSFLLEFSGYIYMKTVTITKKEYNSLKKKAVIDVELVKSIKRSLEDLKAGRITEWKHTK